MNTPVHGEVRGLPAVSHTAHPVERESRFTPSTQLAQGSNKGPTVLCSEQKPNLHGGVETTGPWISQATVGVRLLNHGTLSSSTVFLRLAY